MRLTVQAPDTGNQPEIDLSHEPTFFFGTRGISGRQSEHVVMIARAGDIETCVVHMLVLLSFEQHDAGITDSWEEMHALRMVVIY